MKRSAVFSPDRRWRYDLRLIWEPEQAPVMFVGLNPSTADEEVNDPTVGRCQGFAESWGYGGLLMANLFAWRATDPRELRKVPDPVGPENDEHLAAMAEQAALVVAAWGVNGALFGRADAVVRGGLLGSFKVLGLTKGGHPLHPLYVKASAKPLDPMTLRAGGIVERPAVDELQLRRGYYTLQTDGSMGSSGQRSKGDPPGEAGIGVVLKDSSDTVVKRISQAIGPATNDVAEYEALIAGLELAHGLGIDRIRVYMDSEFIVDQMNGRSDVDEVDLRVLHEKAFGLFGRFSSRRISWIPREWNREADKLASEARKQKGSPT